MNDNKENVEKFKSEADQIAVYAFRIESLEQLTEFQSNQIEAQKEETEEYKERYTDSQFHVKALTDVGAVHLQQIESLKAITKLAVKALQQIASGGFWNADRYIEIAQNSLSEIARSAHE